jgi:hypothetical protein
MICKKSVLRINEGLIQHSFCKFCGGGDSFSNFCNNNLNSVFQGFGKAGHGHCSLPKHPDYLAVLNIMGKSGQYKSARND